MTQSAQDRSGEMNDFSDEEIGTGVRSVRGTSRPTSQGKLVGCDPQLLKVLETIDRVSRATCNVLITGESGTGKELVVAALHDSSTRREGPLVAVNCGAIPNELVEAELFGHTKGAFTGAQINRRGFVAAAEGGTLFLDEVGELPLAVQVKLLRLLQAREYTPLGESRPVRCDVRVVAATNRDLAAEVAAGRFREDLYYRLNVIHLHLPALRERKGDVNLLALHFFRAYAERSGRNDLLGFSIDALNALERHDWPGNIRALQNTIERAVLLAPGPYIREEDLQLPQNGEASASEDRPTLQKLPVASSSEEVRQWLMDLPDQGIDLSEVLKTLQVQMIRQALARTGGNKNRAAQLLGLNRTTLVEMIRRRGLETGAKEG